MKKGRMIKSFLVLFILMGLMAVMPREAKAATSDRIPIDKVEATSNINSVFGIGKKVKTPSVDIQGRSPAFIDGMYWQVMTVNGWIDLQEGANDGLFAPGRYRIEAHVRTEDYYYVLDRQTNLVIDGKRWESGGDPNVFEDYSTNVYYSPWFDIPWTAAPKLISAKLSEYNSIKVEWSKVPKASGYAIYYKEKSTPEYKYFGYTSKTNVTIKKLDCGKQYVVRIFSFEKAGKKGYQGGSVDTPGIYTLNKVGKPTVTKYASKKVKVKWQGTPRSSGYMVRVTQKTTFRKYHSDFNVKKKTKAIFKVKRKKRFYYRVREYRVVGGKKIYGPWSKEKSYKLK